MTEYTAKDRRIMEEKHGQINIFEQIEKEENKMEKTTYSLDQFGGQDAPYSDMFVGFDTSKDPSSNEFVITSEKENFENLADFKEQTNCEIAFSQKEFTECENVVALYEKRIEVARLKDKKSNTRSADKETKAIKELENSGYASEEVEISETIEEPKEKRKKSLKI